jgi:hypothetical protein
LEEQETRSHRWSTALLILLAHGLLIEALLRESKQIRFPRHDLSEPLRVYLLPGEGSPAIDSPKAYRSSMVPPRRSAPKGKMPTEEPPTITHPIEELTPRPQIDWQHELELAALNGVTDEETTRSYLDLSKSMSPSQLEWLKQHRMEPASSPGLTWKRPRVEITKDGLPIVHLNDHCVLVPLFLIPMVFCSVGHIEPNGDLFNHLHDPRQP